MKFENETETAAGSNESGEVVAEMCASIGRRFLAFLIDGLILGLFSMITAHIVPVLGPIAAWFFYGPILESSEIRATLGKHLMGIQVTDLMGRRISLKAALIRNAMKVVSTAIFCIGFLFALFNRRKQTLHDLLADTLVIYGRNETEVFDAWLENSKEAFRAGTAKFESSAASSPNDESIVAQLERLKALHTNGDLTNAEYEAAKNKILNH